MKAALILAMMTMALHSPAIPAWAQDGITGEWYSSNESGMSLRAIDGPEDSTWALRVDRYGDEERATLYENGIGVRSWLREYQGNGVLRREALEENGVITQEHLFDAVGYPELSRRFLSDGTVEETAFVYEGGRLVTRSTALNGNPVSVVRYLYAPDGRLLVARDDAGAVIGSAYQAGGASRMWRVADGLVELREYDSSGRLVSLSSYEGAKRLYYEERSWQGGVLQKTVVMDAEGASTSTWFATEGAALGKPTVALILLPDGTEASDSNLYDEAGRLMVRESASSSGSSRVEYTYDAVGALLVERRFSDGLPSMVVRYESDGVRVEESYEKGVAFARVRYEDGRKVLEEILKNGLVVRSRSFE